MEDGKHACLAYSFDQHLAARPDVVEVRTASGTHARQRTDSQKACGTWTAIPTPNGPHLLPSVACLTS
jgi:hypothetical protein